MAKREKGDMKIRASAKYTPILSMLMLVLALICTYLCAVAALTPKNYQLDVGSIVTEAIYATRNIVDEETTNTLKELAKNNTPAKYSANSDRTSALLSGAEGFFTDIDELRAEAYSTRSSYNTHGDDEAKLSDDDEQRFMTMTTPKLDEVALYEVIEASDAEIKLLRDLVLPKLSTSLEAGLFESVVDDVKAACVRELNASTGLSSELKNIGQLVIDEYMQATYVLDEMATQRAKQEAADAVEDVMVQKGELIAAAGTQLTSSQLAMLKELELVRDGDSDLNLNIGAAIFLSVGYVLFAVYMMMMRREVFLNLKQMLIITVLIVVTMLLMLLCTTLNAGITPAMIAVMLTALLICERSSLAVCLLLALSTGLMAGGRGSTLMQFDSLVMCVSTVASGVATVFAIRRTQSRGTIIAAGAMGGLAGALAILGMYVMTGRSVGAIFSDMGWTMGSCVFCALLVVGSLSIWERVFDVATTARLHELLNTGNPLLRQLMSEAPGTYQHSMAVATLAEGAAQRVGADPLLARVGASYHDAGKLRRPLYFKENQKPNENIHDTLPPSESASTIIAHQRDGVMILKKQKFPSAVINIVGEHHGNSLVAYFYYKAKRDEGENISPKQYRYTGTRPSTKESAIVMLADSCEAAVRSLGDCTREAREEMVHKVIWGKMREDDNQLSNAPLTLGEISDIERSFLRTFNGIMHDRIEYPDGEDKR